MEWTPTPIEIAKLIAINSDITTSERIEHYTTLAPIYLNFAQEDCNDFTLEPTNMNVQLFIAKAIQFYTQKAGLTSRSMGTVSYSYTTELPSSVMKPLKPFKKLRW